jgi:glycosyltransferase involved in cell wall biosynthesis
MVVAPSYAMHDAMQRHYGPLERAQVVLNGRSGPFQPAEKEPFVVTAGRLWDEGKNVAALARIAGDLPWPVYVAGSTVSPDGQSATLGALRPLGHLAPGELAAWLGRASIYALPARYEPFGLSVVEAALSGCALVLGDIRSLRELWGDAATYVDPDDDAALTRAVEWLCVDPALRRSLAERARRRALEMTPSRMAEGYLRVYASAVAHHGMRQEAVACAS